MTVVVGHPTGNPNSHHAALAYLEADRLATFCTPWLPSRAELDYLRWVPGATRLVGRLARRSFAPLQATVLVQNRTLAICSLLWRAIWPKGDITAARLGNEWLMRTLSRELNRGGVTAVHSFEDCSLLPFRKAGSRNQSRIYDLPIGYFEEWRRLSGALHEKYADWVPSRGHGSESVYVSGEQKAEEMKLADLVLTPSSFVEETVRRFHPHKRVARAAYGVEAEFWTPSPLRRENGQLRIIFAGQASLRKGTPLLIDAWAKAALPDAELRLVGTWGLKEDKKRALPDNVTWFPPCSSVELRRHFHQSDAMIFPSNFEGLALVLLEAMACGLPAIATSTAGIDLIDDRCGRVITPDDLEQLIEGLRWIGANRDSLRRMGVESRKVAERFSWRSYRDAVRAATAQWV